MTATHDPAVPVRFGTTVVQVLPLPLLRDDFVFVESIGLDDAWVIDLANLAAPLFDELVTAHRMATREQLERVAHEVLPRFRT